MSLNFLKTYAERWKSEAPGDVRARIQACIDDPAAGLSRADKSDLQRLQAGLTPLDCSGAAGKAWFPIVFSDSADGPPGTLAWLKVVVGCQRGDRALKDRAEAVRTWLAASLEPLLDVSAALIRDRLTSLELVWAAGHAYAPTIALGGNSLDLAMVLAILRHLVPHGSGLSQSWIVSGAIGMKPNVIEPIDHAATKRAIVQCEAPAAKVLIAEERVDFQSWLVETCGPAMICELQSAFGQTPEAIVSRAESEWRNGHEAGAAANAQAALALVDTPRLRARCHLILGSDAVHRGDLAGANTHFGALDAIADAADGWNRWDTIEQHVRIAAFRIDQLNTHDVRRHLAFAAQRLEDVPSDMRDERWSNLFVQMRGTESKALALEGDLEGAVAARRETLTHGPAGERARSHLELGELLLRQGDTDAGRAALDAAERDLAHIGDPANKAHTARFIRIARIRWGLAAPSVVALDTAPDLRQWPQPAECIESLLTSGDEELALQWFQKHVLGRDWKHPAFALYLVTSCARAVQNGFADEAWRVAARTFASALPDAQRQLAEAFADGAAPTALLLRALY